MYIWIVCLTFSNDNQENIFWREREFRYFKLNLFICLFCLHISLWTMFLPGIYAWQKRALELLELKLLKAVSYHMGAGIQTCIHWKNTSALDLHTPEFLPFKSVILLRNMGIFWGCISIEVLIIFLFRT